MKNKDGDSVICGTLTSSFPMTIAIKVIGDGDTVLDNISGLRDMGYCAEVKESLDKKQDVECQLDLVDVNELEIKEYVKCLLSFEHAYNVFGILKSNEIKTQKETQLYEFLKIRLEFFGDFVDGCK